TNVAYPEEATHSLLAADVAGEPAGAAQVATGIAAQSGLTRAAAAALALSPEGPKEGRRERLSAIDGSIQRQRQRPAGARAVLPEDLGVERRRARTAGAGEPPGAAEDRRLRGPAHVEVPGHGAVQALDRGVLQFERVPVGCGQRQALTGVLEA